MMTRLILAFAFLLSLVQTSEAHLRLTSHESRYGDDQKAGPCGRADGVRTTDKVYSAKPGTQVMLVWDEFINHPGFFRIDFDLDGADDFTDPILPCADQTSIVDCFDTTDTGPYMVNNITDEAEASQSYLYTLPDEECTNCTLQIVQAMQDKPPYTIPGNEMYYQCIDIVLDANGPDQLTLMGEEPEGPDAGVAEPGADAGEAEEVEELGCGCQSSGSGGGLWFAALAFLVFVRTRQRRC